jgi:hypothetical protein
MTLALFTNRPEFAVFACHQLSKLDRDNWQIIVLDNGPGNDLYNHQGIRYVNNREWRGLDDMFNWLRLQKEYHGFPLLINDDDISLHRDPYDEIIKYFSCGWDRICFSEIGIYDINTGETGIANWHAENQGFMMAIRERFWHFSIYKSGRPDQLEGMVYYYSKLPYHNARVVPALACTHLIHGKNVINHQGHFHKLPAWGMENPYIGTVREEVDQFLKPYLERGEVCQKSS